MAARNKAGRRGNHEGSIYQRTDGRWVAELFLGHRPDGSRRMWRSYGKTRTEVAQALRRAQAELLAGVTIDPSKVTLGSYLESWLRDSARPSVKASTYRGYAVNIHRHVIPILGHVRLDALRPDQVAALYAQKQREGLSPTSVLYIHATLRRALKQAVRWGMIPRNPAEAVDRPRKARHEVTVMDARERQRFLNSVKGDRLEALFVLLLGSGVRVGEALALRWSDFDPEQGTIAIRGTLAAVKGGSPTITEPKTATSRRKISLPAVVVETLEDHRTRQLAERTTAGKDYDNHDLIFCSHEGKPLLYRNVFRTFKRLLERAGLPASIRIHDLRHCNAVMMLEAGVHPRVAMARLGHSTIQVTMNVYSHVLPDVETEAARRLERQLGQGGEANAD